MSGNRITKDTIDKPVINPENDTIDSDKDTPMTTTWAFILTLTT